MVLAAPILVSIPPDQGWLATNSKAPALVPQIGTPSPLCSPQVHESQRKCWDQEGTLFGRQRRQWVLAKYPSTLDLDARFFYGSDVGEVRKQIQKAIQSL